MKNLDVSMGFNLNKMLVLKRMRRIVLTKTHLLFKLKYFLFLIKVLALDTETLNVKGNLVCFFYWLEVASKHHVYGMFKIGADFGLQTQNQDYRLSYILSFTDKRKLTAPLHLTSIFHSHLLLDIFTFNQTIYSRDRSTVEK